MSLAATAFGVVYGLAARGAGYSIVDAMAMSLIVFAGASQFAAVGFVAQGMPWIAIVGLTFLLNARHVLYSAALAPWLQRTPAPGACCDGARPHGRVVRAGARALRADRPRRRARLLDRRAVHLDPVAGRDDRGLPRRPARAGPHSAGPRHRLPGRDGRTRRRRRSPGAGSSPPRSVASSWGWPLRCSRARRSASWSAASSGPGFGLAVPRRGRDATVADDAPSLD